MIFRVFPTNPLKKNFLEIIRGCECKFERYWLLTEIINERTFFEPEQLRNLLIFGTVMIPNIIQNFQLEVEVKYYLGELPIEPVENSLLWWKSRRRLDSLRTLALSYLSLPFSSTSVERSFSILKDLTSPKRNRLTNENIRNEMKVRFNSLND